ncbi:MAG: hypothetical protein IKZ59_04475 [Clostridia bacterium]|nr:hypothetical protein [Clostridia bacterium]
MYNKKTVSALLAVALFLSMFTGCGKKSGVKYGYNGNEKIMTVSSQTIAQNDNLSLSWDDEAKRILLENRKTGKIWSDIPQDIAESGELCSTLDISVQDMEIYQPEFLSSNECRESGRISAEKIKDGLRVTYYFDSVKVSVPVCYTLREDSMLVSIDASKIQEDGEKYRLVYATPMPKMCSAENASADKKKDSYLLLPEANGALMYTDETVEGSRKISIPYANAAAHQESFAVNAPESSGICVFGIKAGTDAMFCIPEETAGSVGISAYAGDISSGLSAVYPNCYFSDYDYFYGKATNSAAIRHLSDRSQSTVSIGYYPLSGEDADYNGMAKKYRSYLEKNGYISVDENILKSAAPYALTVLGGVMTTVSVLGVPTKTLKVMTTFDQARELIEDITERTGIKPTVRLQGFTSTGINIGKIGGGYSFNSAFGGDKQRKALENYCADNGISLYTEFEMIKYSESGAGFSYANDCAKTAVLSPAENSKYNAPLRDVNSDSVYRLLSRDKIGKAVDKLIKTVQDKDVSGIGVSTLGAISYSDFSSGVKNAVTSGIDSETSKAIRKLKNTGKRVSASSPAYFAAGLVDAVFDAPLDQSGKYQYDVEIPFYQLVYSGVVPMYSSAVNMAADPNKKIMMAAMTGTGLGFSVISNFEDEYMETGADKLYAYLYDANSDLITDALKEYSRLYAAIGNSRIKRYDILENSISRTVFENGVTVYANNSFLESDSPIGKLKGYEFRMGGEKS